MNDNAALESRPFAAAAAFLRANPRTLCLTAHDGGIAALQKCLAAKEGISPPIIAMPRLLSAAAAGVCADNLAAAARLSSASPSAVRRELTISLYASLRENAPSAAAAELFPRAAALSDFFAEFMESRPSLKVAAEELPQLCEKMLRETDAVRAEVDAVSILWELLHPRLHSARDALAEFARIAPPLAFVAAEPPPPWIGDFLQQCARGAEVFAPNSPAAESADGAREWRPRVSHIVRCCEGASASLHRAAHLALAALREFAAADNTVGVVVYDRLLARRLRAVAERGGVHIKDDGGWKMETLSFGGALRQWMETAGAFSPSRFSAMLAPPFWKNDSRRAAAAQKWRKLFSGSGSLPLSLRDFSRAQFADEPFAPFAENLAAARRARPSSAPPRLWARWLLSHSAAAMAAWREDPVAAELRAELAAAGGDDHLNPDEFRAWLNLFMRAEKGGEGDIASRAHFVPPTTSRRFDSLILLGPNADNLPSPPDSFWGENGRRALQLPGRSEEVAGQIAQFDRLISAHTRIAAILHDAENGRDAAHSPFWTLLTDEIKNGGGIVETIAPPPEEFANNDSLFAELRPPPRAAGRMNAPPSAIRVSAASDLMRCPYHFFARHLLRLGEEEEDDILLPAARGNLLHRGLKSFIEQAGDETDADKLLALWRETIAALPAARPGAKLAIQHWLLRGELFVRNEAARRADGWRPQQLEYAAESTLPPARGGFVLRGRIDRVDHNRKTGQWAVIDYKSGGGPSRKDMQTGEDPQLPLYALLLGKPRARWRICYPADDTKTIEVDGEVLRIAARLRRAAARIVAGALLPARKSESCKRCPSRRLCRRDHWLQTEDGDKAAAANSAPEKRG